MMRLVGRRSGQGIVEAALALPVLLLVIIGAVECFHAFNIKHVLTDAAREGAREAVVQDPSITPDSVRATIINRLGDAGISTSSATITFDSVPPPSGHWRETGAMQSVFVGLWYRWGLLGKVFRALGQSDSVAIKVRVSMRTE